MNKKFVYQVGDNKKTDCRCTETQAPQKALPTSLRDHIRFILKVNNNFRHNFGVSWAVYRSRVFEETTYKQFGGGAGGGGGRNGKKSMTCAAPDWWFRGAWGWWGKEQMRGDKGQRSGINNCCKSCSHGEALQQVVIQHATRIRQQTSRHFWKFCPLVVVNTLSLWGGEVFMAKKIQTVVFRITTPCSLLRRHSR